MLRCPQGKLSSKAPFSHYPSLGAEVVWGSPTDTAAYPAGSWDVVIDNNGKVCGMFAAVKDVQATE